MLKNAKMMGRYILESLEKLKQRFPCIKDVRGLGLMIGMELNVEGKDIYNECFERGLIINCTQGNILRLMPALNVTKKEADKAIYILGEVLKEKEAAGA
jgi:4-aminobutyrate aminotransferase-like enzyme